MASGLCFQTIKIQSQCRISVADQNPVLYGVRYIPAGQK